MDYEVTKIEMKQTFKECPACQYSDGFHNMFEKAAFLLLMPIAFMLISPDQPF